MPQLIDRSKLYFYLALLIILLSLHNTKSIIFVENYFKIKEFDLTGDVDKKTILTISKSLEEFYDYNIFLLNSDEVKNTLENFNIINHYRVKKEYPSKIKIEFKETNILAYYIKDNKKIYIGENGKKITKVKVENDNIPLIVGTIDIKKFLELKKLLINKRFHWEDFTTFYSYNSNRWDLIYKDQVTIKLPMNNLDDSLNLLKKIINKQDVIIFKIIDLRLKDRVILS